MKIIYKPTILNISTGIYLLVILIYTIINFKVLSFEEGWGIVAMVALAAMGLAAGFVDFILQQLLKNKIILNIIGLFIMIGLAIFILKDF